MKILYDHQTFELQKFGGISRYFFELINHFEQDNEIDWDLSVRYSDNEYLKNSNFYKEQLLSIPPTHNYLRNFLWGSQFKGKRILYNLKKRILPEPSSIDYRAINKAMSIESLKKGNFDVFHPTYYDDYFLEFIKDKPFVLTIYDLIHQIFPEYFMYSDVDKNATLMQKAAKIIAISESTKKDIVSIFGIDEKKIEVTYLANSLNTDMVRVDPSFKEQIPDSYFLFVGNRQGYKNFHFFIQMISSLGNAESNVKVVCTGSAFSEEEIRYFHKIGMSQRVRHVYVNDQELAYLYQKAIAFVFPSMYEGFGIPVLESFSCGCPVLLSHTSSLKEIGAEAVIYFDPKDPYSMRQALSTALHNKELLVEKVTSGFSQLQKFSWQKTAALTKKIYNEAVYK